MDHVIEAAAPAKYKHINFKPPEGVRKAAKRGLEMRKEHGRGGTAVGVARARDLMNGKQISPSTARRMKAYFDRHQPDQKAEGFDSGEDGYPSAGRVAWELWGGDAGYSWAKKLVKQMNSADEKGKVKSSVVVAISVDEAKDILGFPRSAKPTPDEIQKAWRRKSAENHPDRGGSTEAMQDVNMAKDVLDGTRRPDRTTPSKSYAPSEKAGMATPPTGGSAEGWKSWTGDWDDIKVGSIIKFSRPWLSRKEKGSKQVGTISSKVYTNKYGKSAVKVNTDNGEEEIRTSTIMYILKDAAEKDVTASSCGCAESCECGCQAPGGGQPPSDMTISNLKQIIRDAEAIMAVLHEDMEIMGWAEDKVSQAKAMVNSVRNYIENDFVDQPVHAFRDSSFDDFSDFSCDECDPWEKQWPLTRLTKHDVHCMSCGRPLLAKDAMDGECRSCHNEIEGGYAALESQPQEPTFTPANTGHHSVAEALLAAAAVLERVRQRT